MLIFSLFATKGGGSKAVLNFSVNSSVLVGDGFPNHDRNHPGANSGPQHQQEDEGGDVKAGCDKPAANRFLFPS